MTSNGQAGADVVLVLMPYARLEHPSIALGILKASLHQRGIRTEVVYANLLFAAEVGLDLVQLVNYGSRGDLNGEWTFRSAAFPEYDADHSFYLERGGRGFSYATRSKLPPDEVEALALDRLRRLHAHTPAFVDRLARRVLARRPRVVGCSSAFEQHLASLALLRRIHELAPDVVTVIGGANCDSEMGVVTVRDFPWVDIAFSGEADVAFAPLCEKLLRAGRALPSSELPLGAIDRARAQALTRDGRCVGPAPRASVPDLDVTPIPDYDDYFATLAEMPFRDAVQPGLQLETSRGCWWGAIKHCTFCGLNGGSMAYRSKTPERVLAELERLSTRYGLTGFSVVDNILDMAYLETVLPHLVESERDYRLFYELKSNLRREQVRLLHDAGVHWIQPGIEALHDDLLRLMDKGCSALTNVQILKYAREHGLHVLWNFLAGFPGDDDAWYAETAAMLPLLHHLPPPGRAQRVRFDRFSVYHNEPERFALRLVPFDSYRSVYPLPPQSVADLAYYFRDADVPCETHDSYGVDTGDLPGVAALRRAADEWRKAAKALSPVILAMEDDGDGIDVIDTRACAPARRVRLEGLAARVYRRCEPAIARRRLVEELGRDNGRPGEAAAVVEAAIDELVAAKLALEVRGKLLALAVPGEIPSPPRAREFPGGHTLAPRPTRLAAGGSSGITG